MINAAAIIHPAETHPGAKIVAVVSRNTKDAQKAAKQYIISMAYVSYEELLADPEIEAVYISVPNGLHGEWAIKSLQAGKHALLEKPFTSNGLEVRRVFEEAERCGKIVVEAFHWQFHPAAHVVKSLIARGKFGDIQRTSALAFGTGRQPTLRVEEITQLLPSLDDLPTSSPSEVPNPFPYAARQMLAYGQLITVLNSGRQKQEEIDRAVIVARSRAIQVYNTLPEDIHWNVSNLQRHTKAGYATMFLHLHLWMHTIIASGYLTDTDYLRRGAGRSNPLSGLISGHVTPNAVAASNLWKNSTRTIGDVLVLSDIINPNAYLSLPFCNQAFYVAGCCYVKEIETEQWNLDHVDRKSEEQSRPTSSDGDTTARSPKKERQVKKPSELFRSLLTSVAANNISTVQQGLTKQTNYWKGIAWVAEALSQRVAGIGASEIDLASITEKLSSSIYVADAGVLKRSTDVQQSATRINGSTV